jgi:hypothetical protein
LDNLGLQTSGLSCKTSRDGIGYGDSTSNLKSDIIKVDPIICENQDIAQMRTPITWMILCRFIALLNIFNAVAWSINFVNDVYSGIIKCDLSHYIQMMHDIICISFVYLNSYWILIRNIAVKAIDKIRLRSSENIFKVRQHL